MSNFQEQSLDESAVFLPVHEFSPEFLHSEKERQALESLLSAGPEAFYSFIDAEHSHCFLSSEEVTQITSWVEDCRLTPPQGLQEENGVEGIAKMNDVCSTYFPFHSDLPAPNLDLGWPEISPGAQMGSITVHTSPPAEGQPPVREIIRRHLQKATQVIALVTDRLTDGLIIADLHNAASRGVPVYIILNQRSIWGNFTLNRLMHPKIRVRVLGGRTFCSRMGKMVVGEMKDNFLLVDLETVIHGSYSLTWTDAHLHRQLITVLQGPAVDSFDREFRVLFAASLPVSDTWRLAESYVQMTHKLKGFLDLQVKEQLPLEIYDPPSPPADSFLDWEAMGVVQWETCIPDNLFDQHEEIVPKEMPLQSNMLFDKNTPIIDGFTNSGNEFLDMKRVCENFSPVINHVLDESASSKGKTRRLTTEKSTSVADKTTRLNNEATEPTQNTATCSSTKRSAVSRRDSILEEKSDMDETSSRVEKRPPRKPIILSWLQPQKRIYGLFNRESKASMSELSQSMVDLSVLNTDSGHVERGVPGSHFKSSVFEPDQMTPAHALKMQRNDEQFRTSHRQRTRFSSFDLLMELRKPKTEWQREQE